ncbi:MAG: sigma-70 family RNA polymerase sigma factor [Lachnospiraceae bacterium]|nr:sigma-70 family RNA polymerase sigma factor [Lachnospiraceae bacterium]
MQSLDEIYQKYAKSVYKYLMSKTHNEDISEELTQETFYQAVKSIDRFDGSCHITTWLCAIAKNQYMAYIRKHPITEELDAVTNTTVRNAATSVNTSPESVSSAESEILAKQNRVELMKKLHLCPEPTREILYLRIFGNMSFSEIGEVMGKTENWARVTYYRGKEKLRKELSDYEE